MPGFIDTVIDSLKQTLDLRLWLYFFAIHLIEAVVALAVIVVFALIGLIALFGSISFASIQSVQQAFSSPAFLLNAVGLIALLAAILLIALIFVSSFFLGMRFNLFNAFLRSKKLDLGSAFNETKPRALTYFKINLLVVAVIALLFALLLLPILLQALAGQQLSGIGAAKAIAYLLIVFLFALLFAVGIFLVSPILCLLAPIAFFGKNGAIDSIKKSIALVKANYWGNLGFVLIYFVIVMGVSWVVGAVAQIIGLIVLLPAIALSAGSAAVGASFLGSMLLYYSILFILLIPFTIWSTVFHTACFRNLYFLDLRLLGKRRK